MSYDKELVKEQIELEDIYNLLDFFNAEPQMFNTYIIAKLFVMAAIVINFIIMKIHNYLNVIVIVVVVLTYLN